MLIMINFLKWNYSKLFVKYLTMTNNKNYFITELTKFGLLII